MRVLVVGGGITGLTVAAGCAEAGCDVMLLERGAFGGAQAPLAVLAPPAEEHLHVWRMSGYAFHLDRDASDVTADGVVVGQCRTVDPEGLIGGWVAECRRRRVSLHPGTPALGLVRFGGSVTGVESHIGSLDADEIVLAGGIPTTRFLAGTPADVALARRYRAYELRGPTQPRPPGIVETEGVRIIGDPVGRVQVEAVEPTELPGRPLALPVAIAELPLLDAGTVPLTATPLGDAMLLRPTWLSGVTLVSGGVASLDEAPRLAAAVVAGVTSGTWT